MPSILNKFTQIFEVPKYSSIFTAINLLLGTGPLIIPEPFFEAGFVLSTIWFIVILSLSYNSALYIGQSIQKINQHLKVDQPTQSLLQKDKSQSVIQDQQDKQNQQKVITTFDHMQQFKILYGQQWKIFPVVTISIYLFGVSISKCIITGKALSKLFADVPVLGTFQFWLGLFFLSGAAFSFKSIDKTKVLQFIIIVVRFISISLMIIGSIIIMFQNGYIQSFIPQKGNSFFNLDFFGDIFSNLVFSFLFHHSLPGLTKQLTHLNQIAYFIKYSFIIVGISMIIVPYTAIMAFGNSLIHPEYHGLGITHKLIYYNQAFKGRLDFIYYIVSFYMFLNVAAFSVYIIVIRTNFLSIVRPQVDASKFSKTTGIFSGILLTIILVIGYLLKDDIQVVLSFTGGIFGCIILFVMPSMQVYKARKLFPVKKSFLNNYIWMPVYIGILGICFMFFNLYLTISNLVK